jgi:enolase
MKSLIKEIKAREILDSRGNPTVEVALKTDLGVFLASVPSGASRGKYEAVELRDGGKRYSGKGVLKAVKNVTEVIGPKLKGKEVSLQKEIDEALIELDGTDQKSNLGANSVCGVSLAVCRAGAKAKNLELFEHIKEISQLPITDYKVPTPCFNVINGGAHAGNQLDIQEFMLVPKEKSFSENLRMGTEIYHKLKEILFKKYGGLATGLGDEGGFAPPFRFSEQALDFILEATRELNYEGKINLFLDVAASQFEEEEKYKMRTGVFTTEGLLRYYSELILKYPIFALEDPFSEDDWEGFQKITKEFGEKTLIAGDDLLVTNPKRLKEAKEKKVVNGVVLKINQVGTVSEALQFAKMAKEFDWKIIVSHRSGETTDGFISDFAVGIGADFIKSGAPARGERTVKYNRLLEIEEKI